MTGLEVTARVKELYPDTRVLIPMTFARPGYLRRALEAGASGYLFKDRPSEELADAVRGVSRGARIVDPRYVFGSDGEPCDVLAASVVRTTMPLPSLLWLLETLINKVVVCRTRCNPFCFFPTA